MFGATLVAGAKRRPAIPALPSDASIDVTGHATGSTTANEFTGFASPAGTVFTSTNWTSPSTSLKYLRASDYRYFVAMTTGEGRDVEVTTWGRNVLLLLRFDEPTGKGIFVHLNGDTNSLSIGVVTGKVDGVGFRFEDGASYTSFSGVPAPADIPGYSSTDTAGDTFTFGCSGWEVYAKFNGVEFWRSDPDIRVPMNRGKVALQGNGSAGFRDIVVDWQAESAVYSNPATAYYDMRDFGFRSVSDTGSINIGTDATKLTVANPSRWSVGDRIIIPVGYEAGAGAVNTVGVGSVWPALHYANDAAMEADTGQSSSTYAYADDTGKVRRSKGDGSWYAWDSALPYTNYKIPRALVAEVTAKSGSDLTLDTAASASVTNAPVYRDNSQFMSWLASANGSLYPIGRYRFPPGLAMDGGNGFTLRFRNGSSLATGPKMLGDGRDIETFFAPDGARGVTLAFSDVDYLTVQGVRVRNNAGPSKFGLSWTTSGVSGITYPHAFRPELCDYGQIIDCAAEDCFVTVGLSYCNYFAVHRPKAIVTEPQLRYLHWQLAPADSNHVDIVDYEVDSEWMIAGAEFFRSDYCNFIRGTLRNAVFSSNSSGGWLVDKLNMTLEEDANYSDESNSPLNPLVNINSNIGNTSGNPASTMNLGGTLRDFRIVVEGPLNASGLVPVIITVNEYNPNIIIEGTEDNESDESPGAYVEHPGWQTGANAFDGIGVRSSGVGTIVRRVRFNGDTHSSKGNIHTEGGSLTASDYVADKAATGSYVTSDTGRQTNADWIAAHP